MRRLIRFFHWSILDFKVLQETRFLRFSTIFLFACFKCDNTGKKV